MKRLILWSLVLWAIAACFSFAAPKPAIVQGRGEWTVDVRFEHPQQILVQVSVKEKPKRFWYSIITATNNTTDDVDFYPKCDLMTETFQIIPAGKNTPAVVFRQIKQRHQAKYPFLELLENAGNKILQGQDNTKDIAIIWPDFDAQAKKIKLFITGLSNETAVIDHPVAKDAAGNPVKVFLRKTLELSYDLQGDPAVRSYTNVIYEGKRWVMR